MLKVFVYGTLKPGERFYADYCADKAIEVIKAYTNGYLYSLPLGYPAMTSGKGRVKGFLLIFAEAAVLDRLDELEDYNPQRMLWENEYYRQKIWVYNRSEKLLGKAWAYLMTLERIQQLGGVLLPSGWWTGGKPQETEEK